MKTFFTTIILIFALSASFGQCNLITSDTEICGGQPLSAYFQSTSSGFDYRVVVSSNPSSPISGFELGDSITITPPATGFEYTVELKPQRRTFIGGWIDCGSIEQVTVKATAHAAIDFQTGSINSEGIILKCGSTTNNPDFVLQISNASTTVATNTSYTIDWGDGSPAYVSSTFNTLSHTYGLGLFTLSLSVSGVGDPSCEPATITHQIFNGSSPVVGIEDPYNFIGSQTLCPPIFTEFEVVNTQNNVPGTIYEMYIAGELIATYNHPPPATFGYLFTETSCGKTASNGVPNTYDISIQAYSPCPGPPDFATLGPIIIGDTIRPDFTFSPNPLCENQIITLTNTTVGTIDAVSCLHISNVAWEISPATGWTLISGNMNGDDQIQVLFDDPTQYDISIEAMSSCDTLSITKRIYISEGANANAIATLDDPCVPSIATFTNLSSNDSTTVYTWSVSPSNGVNFINGANSHSFEPVIQFNNKGSYTVTLSVGNQCGSASWDTTFNLVSTVNFNLPNIPDICADSFVFDQNINFNGSIDSIVWVFNGGTPSVFVGNNPPPVTFFDETIHSISVSAYNACGVRTKVESFTLSHPVTVFAGNDTTVCSTQAPFNLMGVPSGGNWTGNGITGSNTFNPSLVNGNSATLTYTFSDGICSISDQMIVTLISIPNLTAGNNEDACIYDDPFILSGQNPIGGFWEGTGITDSIQGIFDPSLSGLGIHNVSYVFTESIAGCRDTATKNIIIHDIPDIQLNLPDTVCADENVTFNLPFTSAIIEWNFGDGNIQTGNNLQHDYTTAGNYTIIVQVTENGCINSDTAVITVIESPQANFTIGNSSLCNNFTLSFTNTTIGLYDAVFWDLGNGQTSTVNSPQQISYPQANGADTTYTIMLVVSNRCNSDTTYQTITFTTGTQIGFDFPDINDVCGTSYIYDEVINFNGQPDSVVWTFEGGDINFYVGINPPPVSFTQDTTHTITISAYNDCGATTQSRSFTISYPQPVEAGDDLFICSYDSPIPLVGIPTNGSWSGNGVSGNSFDPSLVNTISEILTYAYNDGICYISDSMVVNLISVDSISAGIDQTTCVNNDEIVLTGQYPNGGWWLGEAITDSIQGFFSPTISDTGIQVVGYVYAEPIIGCLDTAFKNITVLPIPEIHFQLPDTACINAVVNFDLTVDQFATVLWDFGDGQTHLGNNTQHYYSTPGSYTIVATVTEMGCTNIDSTIIHVIKRPVASFNYVDIGQCNTLLINFENTSTGYYDHSYWNLGNGITSTANSPQSIGYQPGSGLDTTYYVALTVSNQCGSNLITSSITFEQKDQVEFDMPSIPNICGNSFEFDETINFSHTADSVVWTFEGGIPETFVGENPPPVTFYQDTIHTITVSAYSECGNNSKQVSFILSHPTSVDAGDDFLICRNADAISLVGSPLNGNWSGLGVENNMFDPSVITASFVTLVYTFTDSVCLISDSLDVTIISIDDISAGSDQYICIDAADIILNGQSPQGGFWNGIGITDSIQGIFSPSVSGVGSHEIAYIYAEPILGCSDTAYKSINVLPLPEISFNLPDTVCINEIIDFDLSVAQFAIVEWDFGDGNTTFSNPTQHYYSTAGSYTIVARVTVSGCTSIDSTIIHVLKRPTASFTFENVGQCNTLLVNFENTSLGHYDHSFWSLGNGTTSTDPSPQFVGYQQGSGSDTSYFVTLTVTNQCGSHLTSNNITFEQKYAVEFEMPALPNICGNSYIFDEDILFTHANDSIIWTFEGGTPGSYVGSDPPPVTFDQDTIHTIIVTAFNECGTTTKQTSFELSHPPIVDAGDNFSICANVAPIQLSGMPANGIWSGSGVSNNIFDPTGVTEDVVTLNYTFNDSVCILADSLEVTIISIDNLSAGTPQNTCINTDELVLVGQTPIGGIWSGAGITDILQGIFNPAISGIGTHQVAYIYTEPILGCQDTAYKNIEVFDIPDIAIHLPDTACLLATVTLNATVDSNTMVQWNFGDGHIGSGISVMHNYGSTGIFSVIATAEQNGCINGDTNHINIITLPEADFSIANPSGCNILEIDFVNQSSGFIESVYWDLGNGQTSMENNPQDIEYTQGVAYDTVYYITLTAYNRCGESSDLDSVLVSKPPVARFGTNYSQYCELDSVVFNNSSYNSPQTYFWDFGNGKTSNAKDPKPQYYNIGINDTTYLVTLVASNNCGSDTARRDVIIKSTNANAFFYIDEISGCEPLNVTLINYSSYGSHPVWNLGDGNVLSADTVEHTFENAGFYTVELAVNNGCSRDTAYAYVEVLESIDAAFSAPDKGCEKGEVKFTNETIGAINSQWQFGDGTTSNLFHPKHIYDPAGTYNITLTVTGANLCTNSITQPIEILEKPIADFDVHANAYCVGDSITFTNLSYAENFMWDFGNGKKSFVFSPVVAYSEDGFYNVSLIVNNDNLCYDTITKSGIVEIMPLPIADFDFVQSEDPILNGLIDFINLSENAGQYIWNFGDGSDLVSTEENPSYEYTTSGPFLIKLIAQSDFGCVDSIVKPIIVEFFGNIFVPNAMSPALGSNTEASIFLPKGHDLLEYELEVYSTYGELLFRTTALEDGRPSEGWDGTFNGKEMPQDNYVWKIQAIFNNGYSWGGPGGDSKKRSALGRFVLLR